MLNVKLFEFQQPGDWYAPNRPVSVNLHAITSLTDGGDIKEGDIYRPSNANEALEPYTGPICFLYLFGQEGITVIGHYHDLLKQINEELSNA